MERRRYYQKDEEGIWRFMPDPAVQRFISRKYYSPIEGATAWDGLVLMFYLGLLLALVAVGVWGVYLVLSAPHTTGNMFILGMWLGLFIGWLTIGRAR